MVGRLTRSESRRLEQALAEALAMGLVPRVAIASLLEGGAIRSENLSRVLHDLRGEMRNGLSLSQALARHPQSFSESFRAVVRIGQRSGDLVGPAESFLAAAAQSETHRFELVGALAYWGVIFLVFLGMSSVLLLDGPNTIGQTHDVDHTEDQGADGVAFDFEGFERPASVALIGALLAGGLLVFLLSSRRGALFRLPGLGGLIRAASLAENMAMLLSAGEKLPQVLRLLARGEHGVRGSSGALERTARRLDDGVPPADAMTAAGLSGRHLKRAVALGVASGDLPRSLRDTAQNFRDRADARHQVVRSAFWLMGMTLVVVTVGWGLTLFYRGLLDVPQVVVWGG